MHEMSMVSHLLSVAEHELSGYSVKKVNQLEITVSKMAGIMQDAFLFAFETLSTGTVFEKAGLNIIERPLDVICCDCSAAYTSDSFSMKCPYCGSAHGQIISNDEVLLTGIDFEELT